MNYLKYIDPKMDIQKQQNNINNNNDNVVKVLKDNEDKFNQNSNM